MQTITPFLWFDDQAEQAAEFYVSVFPNSEILRVNRSGGGGIGDPGTVMSVSLVIDGLRIEAFNGGPDHPFTEAISLFVPADTQDEIDRLWDRLLEGGGREVQCGWLKDRWGLSWQIVPTVLFELLADPDPARAHRARLQRHHERAVVQAPPAQPGCGVAQGKDLGVRGRVAGRLAPVAPAPDDVAPRPDDDRADRHVTGDQGEPRLGERLLHGRGVVLHGSVLHPASLSGHGSPGNGPSQPVPCSYAPARSRPPAHLPQAHGAP